MQILIRNQDCTKENYHTMALNMDKIKKKKRKKYTRNKIPKN